MYIMQPQTSILVASRDKFHRVYIGAATYGHIHV